MEDVDNMDTVRKSPIKLDHATLRTSDLEGTRNFLEAVPDLTPGYKPAFPFPGHWLYARGEPILHIIPRRGGRVPPQREKNEAPGLPPPRERPCLGHATAASAKIL